MADRPAAAEQETAVAVLGPATAAGDPHASNADAALSKKLCAFCGGDAGAFGGNLGRMQGPFFTSSKGHDAPIYVHHECALWSPQVRIYSLAVSSCNPACCCAYVTAAAGAGECCDSLLYL